MKLLRPNIFLLAIIHWFTFIGTPAEAQWGSLFTGSGGQDGVKVGEFSHCDDLATVWTAGPAKVSITRDSSIQLYAEVVYSWAGRSDAPDLNPTNWVSGTLILISGNETYSGTLSDGPISVPITIQWNSHEAKFRVTDLDLHYGIRYYRSACGWSEDMWFRYNAAPFWLTHKWEEYAVELRSAYQELSRQRSAVQTLADDATDFDFRRVQVEWSPHGSPDGSPGPTWDVRIQPGLSSKAQRTYQNARLVYDTITLPLGLASKAKNLREIQVRDFGKEWLEDKVEDVILKSMVEIANHVGDLGERLFYMASGSSPARKTGLTQDQAYALANSMRQEYWSIARRAAPFVESYNAEVAAFNAARQAFLADLNATGELTDYEKMLVRDRLLLPIGPINVPAIPSAPEYLSVPGKPLLNPQGLDVIRVDPNGSMTLPPASVFPSPEAQVGLYSFDYAPASDGFAATGSTPGAVFHRWTQRGFDGQLLRVIHAGNSGDPGPEEIVVDGGDPANSGIYSRTALSEDGQILSVDTFQVLVGTLGGAPAEVDLLPAQLDHAAGTPLLLAPIVRSETVYGLDWFKNGTLIASNVGSLSFLGGVGIADSGVYEVSVTNGGGSVLSQPFVLSVRTIAAPLVTVPRARLDSRRARPVRATATVRNTGPSPDAILVRGSRGNRFFRVTYASGSNVTAPMLAGIFSLGVRAVGDLPVPVSARVVPNRRALVRGGRTVRRTFNLDFRATAATTGSSHQRRVRIGTR